MADELPKTDLEKAQAYRAELVEKLDPVLDVLRRAAKDGLTVNYHIGPDAGGSPHLANLVISKVLA